MTLESFIALAKENAASDLHLEAGLPAALRIRGALRTVGEPVPMVAKAPQMCVTEPVPYAIGPTIGGMADTFEQVVYFRQVARGNIVIGGGGHELADIDKRRAYVNPSRTL